MFKSRARNITSRNEQLWVWYLLISKWGGANLKSCDFILKPLLVDSKTEKGTGSTLQ